MKYVAQIIGTLCITALVGGCMVMIYESDASRFAAHERIAVECVKSGGQWVRSFVAFECVRAGK